MKLRNEYRPTPPIRIEIRKAQLLPTGLDAHRVKKSSRSAIPPKSSLLIWIDGSRSFSASLSSMRDERRSTLRRQISSCSACFLRIVCSIGSKPCRSTADLSSPMKEPTVRSMIRSMNDAISPAASDWERASIYLSRSFFRIINGGYPARINSRLEIARAVRPFPSMKGWMCASQACSTAARSGAGESLFSRDHASHCSICDITSFHVFGGMCLEPLIITRSFLNCPPPGRSPRISL